MACYLHIKIGGVNVKVIFLKFGMGSQEFRIHRYGHCAYGKYNQQPQQSGIWCRRCGGLNDFLHLLPMDGYISPTVFSQ